MLLLQGAKERVREVLELLGCLSLAERGLRFGKPGQAWLAGGVLAMAFAGMAPLPISLICAALGMVLLSIVSRKDVYLSYVRLARPHIVRGHEPYWGSAGTKWSNCQVAQFLVNKTEGLPPIMFLGLIMLLAMTLSDVKNNADTAVTIGASCAFLTPIGHQNNSLVIGPGEYRFGDY